MKSTSEMSKALLWGALIFLLTLTLVGHAAAQTCVQPPDGLVSWWPLDGNTEDIQDGNPGILVGGRTGRFVPGKVSLAFKSGGGGSLVLVNDAPNLDVTQFTIDAWVKVNVVNPFNMPIVWKGDSTGANVTTPYAVAVSGTDAATPGKLIIALSNGAVDQVEFSSSVLPSGTFTHIGVTVDSSNVRIYIDGQLDAQIGQVVTPFNSAFPLQIGSLSGTTKASFFNGIIDEVEIFNRALSASEIEDIFNAGSAGKCKECPVATALEEDPNKEAKLELLRQFRDEVLGVSPEGEHYVQLFYTHAGEVSWLLLSYPELRSQSWVLIDRFLPVVQSVLAEEAAAVRQAELKDVEALLGAFAAYASAELQADLRAIQEELQEGTVLGEFGITLGD